MNKKIFISIAVTSITIPFLFSCNNNQIDNTCSIVKEHYKTYFYYDTDLDDYEIKPTEKIKEEFVSYPINDIETYKFNDKESKKYPYIDYKDDSHRNDWPAREHLSRTLKIAIVAEDRNSDELRDIAKKLTYHWIFSNYHNINWWQNELGANDTLAKIGLFVFDYLGPKGQAAFNGKLRESSVKYRPSLLTHTGANMFDYIDISCRNAAINNDKEEMSIAFERMKQEITDDNIEGFQKDGSFFQHGRQVQNVSYGKCAMRIAKTLYQLRGTSFKLPDDKMKILSDYVLRGLRASTFKGYTNYTTVGRAYDRVNNLDTQDNTDSGLNDLAYYIGIDNYPGKDETYEFVSSLKKRENCIKEDKIFYFPVAKMIVANIGHSDTNKNGIYISFKGTEPNIVNTEYVNGENQLGLNLTYGTNTCVMDKGNEYFNIAPVMNYNYMPGTTSVFYGDKGSDPTAIRSQDESLINFAQNVYSDPLFIEKVTPDDGTNKYIYNDGQSEEGITFLMAKTQHHKRANYTVTCFTTNDGMVLVGSDFTYTKLKDEEESPKDTNMHTTLDQYITPDAEVLPEETSQSSIQNHHTTGNVKYTSLDKNTISKTIQTRKYEGDKEKEGFTDYWAWNRNNKHLKTTDSGTKNVATITLDGNTNKYAYAIEPYSIAPSKFKLAYNDNGIHAIELPNNKIAAAFYNPNHLSFNYDNHDYSISESEFITSKGAFKVFDKKQ